jgi:hypothetical protein
MTRRPPLTLCLALCVGCGDEGGPIDCESVVMTTPDGTIDDCDLQACKAACGDDCTETCEILESFPPQYRCGDEGPFSVYDFCPDWEPPDTGGED